MNFDPTKEGGFLSPWLYRGNIPQSNYEVSSTRKILELSFKKANGKLPRLARRLGLRATTVARWYMGSYPSEDHICRLERFLIENETPRQRVPREVRPSPTAGSGEMSTEGS